MAVTKKLVSNSARKVKTVPKGAIALVAKGKVRVEDDTHEADITKGETFYIQHVVGKGFFVFDLDDNGQTIHKFQVTGAIFKAIKKANTPAATTRSTRSPRTTGKTLKPKTNASFIKMLSALPGTPKVDTTDSSGKITLHFSNVSDSWKAPVNQTLIKDASKAGFNVTSAHRGKVFLLPKVTNGGFTRNDALPISGSRVARIEGVSIKSISDVFGAPGEGIEKTPVNYAFSSGSYSFAAYAWKTMPRSKTASFSLQIAAPSLNEELLAKFADIVGGTLQVD